mmetsp:Transcript_16758/g.20151  ORF Transcript_16758/g.20151 Transcript_16758/m.20151 type:complete len:279 (-) Transcript_16758:1318-2154(-)
MTSTPFPELPSLPQITTEPHTHQEILSNGAFILHNLLSKEECLHLVNSAESIGMQSVAKEGYRANYRNNDRVQMNAQQLASLVFKRARPFLHDVSLSSEKQIPGIPPSRYTHGDWKVAGLNEAFRICKYTSGGHFSPHRDADYKRSDDNKSFMTFMIYLNEEFEGGTTNFVKDQQLNFNKEKKIYEALEGTITHRVQPQAGSALCFYHDLLHEGEQLQSGTKYIARTDVMYQRTQPIHPHRDNERQALLREAERLEACRGKEMDAMELYRRAEKLVDK